MDVPSKDELLADNVEQEEQYRELTVAALKRELADLQIELDDARTSKDFATREDQEDTVEEIKWLMRRAQVVLDEKLDAEVNEREVTVLLTQSEAEALLKAGNDSWVYQNDPALQRAVEALLGALEGRD